MPEGASGSPSGDPDLLLWHREIDLPDLCTVDPTKKSCLICGVCICYDPGDNKSCPVHGTSSVHGRSLDHDTYYRDLDWPPDWNIAKSSLAAYQEKRKARLLPRRPGPYDFDTARPAQSPPKKQESCKSCMGSGLKFNNPTAQCPSCKGRGVR